MDEVNEYGDQADEGSAADTSGRVLDAVLAGRGRAGQATGVRSADVDKADRIPPAGVGGSPSSFSVEEKEAFRGREGNR